MTLNSCKENVFPKWIFSQPERKERELREGDFKQWDVKCHKISLNKSYHFSYPFFWSCPCVKLMIFSTEIAFCRKGAKLDLKQTPNFRAVLQPSAASLAGKQNTSRAWRKLQLPSGLYMQWKYQKCWCWTGNCMHLQVWFFLHNFSARHSFPFCISTTRIQKQRIMSTLSIRAHWKQFHWFL